MRRHFSDELRQYCIAVGFKTIASAMPGCQVIAARDPLDIYRTDWLILVQPTSRQSRARP